MSNVINKLTNSINELENDFKKLADLDTCKRPITKSRHVGIEIEAISPYPLSYIQALFITAGLNKYCSLGEDGSVEPDNNMQEYCDFEDWEDYLDDNITNLFKLEDNYSDLEIDTYLYLHKIKPAPKKSSYKQSCFEMRVLATEYSLPLILSKVGRFLKSISATTNTSCGMHVHLDMRNRNVKAAYKRLVNSLPELEAQVGKDRLNNMFTIKNEYNDFDKQLRIHDRYRAINALSYEDKKTLEVRLHEGSVDVKKILNWCRLLICIADNKGVKYVTKRKTRAS